MEELEAEIREWNSETAVPGSGNIWAVGLRVDSCVGTEGKVREPQAGKRAESTYTSSHPRWCSGSDWRKKSTYGAGNLVFEKLLPSLILCESVAKLLVDHAFKES